MKKSSNDLIVMKGQAVRLLGVSGRSFDRLVQEGVFVPHERGRGPKPSTFDASALVAAYVAHREERSGALDLAEEKAGLTRAQKEKAELDLAARRGDLVSAAEAQATQEAVADVVREAVLGIAAEAVSAALVPRAREAELDAVCRRALSAIAEKGTEDAAA